MKDYLADMYGDIESIQDNPDYGRLVNKNHANRLSNLLKDSVKLGSIIEYGGIYDEETSFMSPTIIRSDFDSPIMKEEIFGPILPILAYKNFKDAISQINRIEAPLACYIFSKKKINTDQFIRDTQSGGVCVNDISLHLMHERLPFGGIGQSGIGKYHGKFGFDELSHLRPVIQNIDRSPLSMFHPPYTQKVKKWVKILKKII